METKYTDLNAWHKNEEIWWNKYGEYMTYQWKLTPLLNFFLRKNLEKDYKNFLFKKDGFLLDLGCGSGWLSAYFAERGMKVLGVDLSEEQIKLANNLKSLHGYKNVVFQCSDIITWDFQEYQGKFDSIFINAFLHHLPKEEIALVLNKVEGLLKKNGVLFMYEPISSLRGRRTTLVKCLDKIYNCICELFLIKIPKFLKGVQDEHKKQIENGYVMQSPHEGPIDIENLESIIANKFELVEIKNWHLYSIGFAMQIMTFKSALQKMYTPLAAIIFTIDQIIFRFINWENFSIPQRFILTSIKLRKK